MKKTPFLPYCSDMDRKAYIQALEKERDGDWDMAHRLIQEIDTPEAAWIHAYLHRVEGDAGNAAYWYRRAGKPVCRTSLAEEWREIFNALALLSANHGEAPNSRKSGSGT